MIFSIDHIVFAVTPDERAEIGGWAVQQRFQPQAFSLNFAESGSSSESWSFGSGGFIELLIENEPGLGAPEWFSATPRVIGLGFASDDFSTDTSWPAEPDVWRMNEDHVLPDGSLLTIDAAGPHRHKSSFYVFVMNRPQRRLEFDPDPGGPRLERVTLSGIDANTWRENLGRWLVLTPDGNGDLVVGDTTFRFLQTTNDLMQVSLSFVGVGDDASQALAAGKIEVAARERVT